MKNAIRVAFFSVLLVGLTAQALAAQSGVERWELATRLIRFALTER